MRINYNVSAMLSNNALANNDSLLAKSLERLSSGLKINHAKDNPAGLAMAKRMNAQIEGLSVASQNASDGVSIIETADGAMTEVSEMLQRMNELAVKASNGILTDADRDTIQKEVEQLKEEIQRVADTTEFNGQKLLNGEFNLKGYVTENGMTGTTVSSVEVVSYSKNFPTGEHELNNLKLSLDSQTGMYSVSYDETGVFAGTTAQMNGKLMTIKGPNSLEMTLDLEKMQPGDVKNVQITTTGIGAMRLQIGSNEGQVLAVEVPAISLRNMGIEDLDVSSKEKAEKALDSISGAITYVSTVRGKLGAYQNRLESTTDSLSITSENMTAAYSRIMDVDMAEEMTRYTTNQVLTQAGTSMLAQANERPSQVLQLLQ